MALLSVQNAGKQFGGVPLFSDVSFEVGNHDKWGLVGNNGCGKTTLFRLLTGEMSPDEGKIVYAKDAVLGYMEQHTGRAADGTLWEATESVFDHLKTMETELAVLTERLADGDAEVIAKHHALRETFEAQGGLYFRGRVRSALLGLGFSEDDLQLPMTALSGGQRAKAAMARLLLSGANLLLLDEPTNHLDIAAVEWLEEFLRNYTGALIIISHDRYFLDRVTTRTLEIAGGVPYITNGNYSAHREKREKDREVLEHHYKTSLREIKHLENSIETLHSFNREKSVRAAESKEKLLEKKKAALIAPESVQKEIAFDFSVEVTGGNEVLTAGDLSMAFGDAPPLFTDVNMKLFRSDRVFLLGPNGCGKTTLLKILSGQLSPRTGFTQTGANVTIGYYDQTQAGLNENNTVMDEIWNAYPRLTQTQVRSALATFLFRGESVFAPIKTLSGGERARVLLLKLMLARNNLLLLDEPTNHLDIASREALENALEGYNGTVLAVSHDRYFINRLASKVLLLTEQGCTVFDGDYDTYLQSLRKEQKTAVPSAPKENDYKKRKEQESNRRKLATRIRRAEEEIAALESQANDVRAALELPENMADYERVTALSAELEQIETALDTAMEQWETLVEQQESEETV